ncbi:MAG: hypothetical protein AAF702_07920 [Chloroflexota bacterium]
MPSIQAGYDEQINLHRRLVGSRLFHGHAVLGTQKHCCPNERYREQAHGLGAGIVAYKMPLLFRKIHLVACCLLSLFLLLLPFLPAQGAYAQQESTQQESLQQGSHDGNDTGTFMTESSTAGATNEADIENSGDMALADDSVESVINYDDEILYLDGQGIIRILDTTQTSPSPIDWFSNESGFTHLATGDFNGDGDIEVAGMKGVGALGRLVVYDPVVSPGTSVPTGRSINGIPWQLMHERAVGFTPLILAAGNLDESSAADEILLGYDIGNGLSEIVILKLTDSIAQTNSLVTELPVGPLGQTRFQFNRLWTSVAIGQMDNVGPDEIVLIDSLYIPDEHESMIAMFQLSALPTNTPFFWRDNSFVSWKRAAIGNIDDDDRIEIVVTRKIECCDTLPDTSHLTPTAWFFEYSTSSNNIVDEDDGCPDEPHLPTTCPDDVDSLYFDPAPSFVFLADMNNTGEKEAVFLRSYALRVANKGTANPNDFIDLPVINTNPPTWFWMVNRGTDVITGEDPDEDQYTTHPKRTLRAGSSPSLADLRLNNEWSAGDSGDFDGDGLEEIAIMQPGAIRIYRYQNNVTFPAPAANPPNFWRQDFVDGAGRQMKSANLDRNSYVDGIELFVDATNLNTDIRAGTTGTTTFEIRTALSESVVATLNIPRRPSWLILNGSSADETNFSVPATIDATSELPGTYQFDVEVISNVASVENSPLTRTFTVTILPALVGIEPQQVTFIDNSCQDTTQSETYNTTIQIDGTPTIAFSAEIVLGNVTGEETEQGEDDSSSGSTTVPIPIQNGPPIQWPSEASWIVATTTRNVIPGSVELTILPENRPNLDESQVVATLQILGDDRTGNAPDNQFSIPIEILCTQSTIHLPFMAIQ